MEECIITTEIINSGDLPNSLNPSEFASEFDALKGRQGSHGEKYSHPTFVGEEVSVIFDGFSFKYGTGNNVLQNINLNLPKNKITAIIGPSGCGKSTLLRSINRMNEEYGKTANEGKLIVDDQNIYEEDVNVFALRTKVGMVFQKPQPFPRSIFDNVSFGPRLHGIKSREQLKQIVEKSLKDVGLWDEVKDRLDQHAFGLSGGQQQRLCIARAIAVNPKIILFDEPASALDPKSTYQIEDMLLELKKNFTVVIVTHNMQQAARISDYSIFIYSGNIIEFSKTSQMFEKPFYTLTENYISGRFG